jgi:hypothetical protein
MKEKVSAVVKQSQGKSKSCFSQLVPDFRRRRRSLYTVEVNKKLSVEELLEKRKRFYE